jgi:acyl carrier protein
MKGDRCLASQAASGREAIPAERRTRGIVDQLGEMVPAERDAFLNEHLRQQVIHILSLSESTRIDEDEVLHDLGLDSLMAVELRNVLAASLGKPWSPTLVLDYPTLRSLKDFLLGEMFGSSQASKQQSQQPEDLSESEAEKLLLQELGGGTLDVNR